MRQHTPTPKWPALQAILDEAPTPTLADWMRLRRHPDPLMRKAAREYLRTAQETTSPPSTPNRETEEN